MKRPIEAFATVAVAFARARGALLDDPGAVFGDTAPAEGRAARRFRTQVTADFGDGTIVGRKIELSVGAGRPVADGGVALPLTWQASSHDRLFPTFEGELEASPCRSGTELRLHGSYTVPLGGLGRLGEGVVGQGVAHRSLDAFLADTARRLEAEVDRRLRTRGTLST